MYCQLTGSDSGPFLAGELGMSARGDAAAEATAPRLDMMPALTSESSAPIFSVLELRQREMHDLAVPKPYPPGFPAVTQDSTCGLTQNTVIARRDILMHTCIRPGRSHAQFVIPTEAEGPRVG